MCAASAILDGDEVFKLERLLEEATRSKDEGVRRFVEPADGTLSRAMARQHHLIFGRRGSGKSSLLRKVRADLTVDRRPIAFVDLESFKGHEYPDVLLSVLIETFLRFADWLETAAIAPATKTSFWTRLFGRKPTRSAFDRKRAAALSGRLREEIRLLRDLLFSEDDSSVQEEVQETARHSRGAKVGARGGTDVIGGTVAGSHETSAEAARKRTTTYARSKVAYLQRHILDYQAIFRDVASLSGGDSYLILDDLYHIRKRDQAQVIDYFHRIAKGNNLWLKIGTIRHRTQWYVHGDPPIGMKINDDVSEINLDLTLEKYKITSDFLEKVLRQFLNEAGVTRSAFLVREAFDRLVLASGGVARDFLGLLRGAILSARARGDTARGEKVGVEDVNAAAGDYDSSKREELNLDTLDDRQRLEDEFERIGRFVNGESKANVFLVDKSLADTELELIEELVDLRLVHRVKSRVTVADRPGKNYEAFMLDVSQYTAARKKRELQIIEFWRDGAADAIRRAGLVYKEVIDGRLVTKG
ncbi:MAG: hypothetical protein ACK6CU_05910 [Deltaproteobacteria bacterium]|jgi:hypothetical protein